MNKVMLTGRLTRNPEIRHFGTDNALKLAKYTLAVDRRNKDAAQSADFISCIAFGTGAELAEKYLSKGKKIAVVGRLSTGSYTGKDGSKVYTTDVVVDEMEFLESKSQPSESPDTDKDGFMEVPEGEELPFS